jgi:hypothetical protein
LHCQELNLEIPYYLAAAETNKPLSEVHVPALYNYLDFISIGTLAAIRWGL